MANNGLAAATFNRIQQGDCIAGMKGLPAGSVDLAFADPPFNIGYEYDVYDDRKERDHYLQWSREWIAAVHRVLKAVGTFWLAIGDEYAAELKLASQEIGFHCRSWVIWYYTFGVNCKQKFSRSHAHLFHFVKDPAKFTFRSDDLDNRVYSARQLVYNDVRGNPTGRLPDDTWILRPQDLQESFTPDEDTWYFPRVAGTFKEREGFHGCQMPEQLLGRIIRFCSEERETVIDPFSGSATTLVVAKKLGRNFVGFELSKEYAARGQARLENVAVGDRLEGAPEPLVSAPLTREGKSLVDAPAKKRIRNKNEILAPQQIPTEHEISRAQSLFEKGLLEAFAKVNNGFSLDRVIADPELNAALAEQCRLLGLPGEARTWNHTLFNLRKRRHLAEIPTIYKTDIDWEKCDSFLFASEIAWKSLTRKHGKSLDELLCDPILATEFDQKAATYAAGFKPLEYRWAALKLRKAAGRKYTRIRASLLKPGKLQKPVSAFKEACKTAPESAGVYVMSIPNETLYVGEALNLRNRFDVQFASDQRRVWKQHCPPSELKIQFFTSDANPVDLIAYQSILLDTYKPTLNSKKLAPV
jgi:site-specific DNA-methyltransferase (adenine-specific)